MKNLFKTIGHYALHCFGLALSLSAIYHTMSQFSNNVLFQRFFGIGGVFAGLSIQYVRGLAAAYKQRNENGDRNKAAWLWFAVILCICIFDFISSFGILVTQIDTTEAQYSALTDSRRDLNSQITKINQDIKRKQDQQDIEFSQKGRGPKYDAFQKEIDDLNGKKDALQTKLDGINTKVDTIKKSIFDRLSEKSGVPAFWIEFIMFAGLMFMIYFIPLLTPWKVTIPGSKKTAGNVTDSNAVTGCNVVTDGDKVTGGNAVTNGNTVTDCNAVTGCNVVTDDNAVTNGNTVTDSNAVTSNNEDRKDETQAQTPQRIPIKKVTPVNPGMCACGCNRPARPGSKYFSDNCKVNFCRKKKKDQKKAVNG